MQALKSLVTAGTVALTALPAMAQSGLLKNTLTTEYTNANCTSDGYLMSMDGVISAIIIGNSKITDYQKVPARQLMEGFIGKVDDAHGKLASSLTGEQAQKLAYEWNASALPPNQNVQDFTGKVKAAADRTLAQIKTVLNATAYNTTDIYVDAQLSRMTVSDAPAPECLGLGS